MLKRLLLHSERPKLHTILAFLSAIKWSLVSVPRQTNAFLAYIKRKEEEAAVSTVHSCASY